ncbi:kinase-like domain-containing protein, partial [Lineolata rhizophorae]
LSEHQVKTVLYQGLLALEHIHANGVIHRDIKPANILVKATQPFVTALADFGLASTSGEKIFKSHCGTPAYCAPEIYDELCGSGSSADRSCWSAVDIWSMAVVA